jgi:hypothetical protein
MKGMTNVLDGLSRHRVKYAEAGAAMRDVLRRANLAHPPLGARERAVLDAVLALTVSYSKLHDVTTTREIAAAAYGLDPAAVHGHQRKRTREILDRLANRGLLEMTPCGRGRSARMVVSVANDKTPPAGDFLDEVEEGMTPAGARNDPFGSHEMTPVSAAHLEDLEGSLEANNGFEEDEERVKVVNNSNVIASDVSVESQPATGPPFTSQVGNSVSAPAAVLVRPRAVRCPICKGCNGPCTECAKEMQRPSSRP